MSTAITMSVDEYAAKITSSWRKAAQSIIETGRYLLDAEDRLPPDQYRQLMLHLVEEVGMSATVMSKLRMIASNPVLTSTENLPKLPPSYATLYRMTQIDEDQLTKAFADDAISSETQLKDIEAIFFATKQARKTQSEPSVTVTFSGNMANVSPQNLKTLKDALDQLSAEVRVSVRGMK